MPPDPETAYRSSHIAWGGFIYLSLITFRVPTRWAFRICCLLILIKEFILDPLFEGEGIEDGLWDSGFHLAGVLLGMLIQYLAEMLLCWKSLCGFTLWGW